MSIASAGMSASYTYNGDGARVKAVVVTGSQAKTSAYVGDYFEISLGDSPRPSEPRQQSTPTPPDCSTNACIYLPLTATSRPELPAGQAWMSYYSAGGQRVVMRVQSNQAELEDGVFYFLSDHLGSTSLTLDEGAGKVAELRYSAWGETRYTDGSTPTQRRYTGQLEAEAGLYYYKARWYDPGLGRFAQPDSIVPNPGNPLDWDRYAYVRNNPQKYVDPNGHKACDGAGVNEDDCEVTQYDIIAAINLSFRWNVAGNWTKRELFILLDSGIAIENKLSTLTDGNGGGWMFSNLGGTTFHKGDLMQIVVMGIVNPFAKNGVWGIVPFHTRDVYLTKAGINTDTITHELGHVLDISTGASICPATWCGGGIADALIEFMGGSPSGIRWMNGTKNIPDGAKWPEYTTDGYGNTATAEYFGEAFKYLITDQTKLPNSLVEYWMKAIISLQSR